ncbi:MAG: DUF998 domain-containing protein [Bacteroidota bacterium]
MSNAIELTKNANKRMQALAKGAILSAGLCLFILVLMHFLKPDYDPTWHFVSEYAIGDYGWVMQLGFFCWSASCFFVYTAIRKEIKSASGKLGLFILFIVGFALIGGGLFIMDPLTTARNEVTGHGNLHGLSGTIGIPGQAIAALLISISLVRNEKWKPAKKSILWAMVFMWVSLVIMFVTIGVMLGKAGGKFGPDVWVGWPNRLLILAYCNWLIVVARQCKKIYQ